MMLLSPCIAAFSSHCCCWYCLLRLPLLLPPCTAAASLHCHLALLLSPCAAPLHCCCLLALPPCTAAASLRCLLALLLSPYTAVSLALLLLSYCLCAVLLPSRIDADAAATVAGDATSLGHSAVIRTDCWRHRSYTSATSTQGSTTTATSQRTMFKHHPRGSTDRS